MQYPSHSPVNFLGLPDQFSDFQASQALILPVPYEATTSYKGGTKYGPEAIIHASTQVELYDQTLGLEPAIQWGIHTLPTLALDLTSQLSAIIGIAEAVAEASSYGKLLGVLGGEHSISVGVAQGLRSSYTDFVVVQLDAHADLRDSYEGSPLSHACMARRVSEHHEIMQLGIRSLDVSEAEFLADCQGRVRCHNADVMRVNRTYLDELVRFVSGKYVFLTMDVDVFDPSIMPSTGTPEPGGLGWYDVLEIIQRIVDNGNVIAFDCVELSPIPGLHAPDFTVAKLIYKLISAVLYKNHKTAS